MKRTACISILLLVLLPALASAQWKPDPKNKINFASLLTGTSGQVKGLVNYIGLDPNRLHISQSYTLSYASIGGNNLSQGVYLNQMQYNFNIPLTMNLEWGISHNPLQATGVQLPMQQGLFLSEASFEYKPSENFRIGVGYSAYPRGLYYSRDLDYRPSLLSNDKQ